MFEIPDDEDDPFWENLPLDEIDGVKQPEKIECQPLASVSNGSFSTSKKYDHTTSVPSTVVKEVNHQNDLYGTSNGFVLDKRQPLLGLSQEPGFNHSSTFSNNRNKVGQVQSGTHANDFKKNWNHQNDTQSVSSVNGQESTTPKGCHSKKLYKSGSKRKFPGPAGVLPSSVGNDCDKFLQKSPEIAIIDNNENCDSLPSSQPSSLDPFLSKPWQSLMSDLGPDAKSVVDKFAVKTMVSKASKRLLPKGKIPLVLAFIESVDFHGCDGSVVLHDPSGKVQGALHHDLIKDPTTALRPGCAIVLRQISVISPSPRTHYLNLTPANIVVIYSQTKDSNIHKLPWSPNTSPPTTPSTQVLPPLSQIIQESQQELDFIIHHNPQAQPQTPPQTPTILSHTSLFERSNATPVSHRIVNPRIINSFKSPMSLSNHPSTSIQSNFNCNRHSLNHYANSPNLFQSSSHSYVQLPASMSTKINQMNSVSKQNQYFSKQNLTSHATLSSNAFKIPSRPNSKFDDFPDDDGDLLSLCGNADNDVTSIPSNLPNNQLSLIDRIESRLNQNHPNNKQFHDNHCDFSSIDDSGQNLNQSYGEKNNSIGIMIRPVATYDSNKTMNQTSNFTNCGRRDSRVQLGMPMSAQTSTKATDRNQLDKNAAAFWDDDLSDDLLSQL